MRDTLSNMVSCMLSNDPLTSAYDEQKFKIFAYLHVLKVFIFLLDIL